MNKFEKTLQFIKTTITETSPYYRRIYLVGGCVRDELLGERYSDLDLLIDLPEGQRSFVEMMCAEHPEVCKGPFYYQRYGTTAMDVVIDGSLTLVECVEPHIEEYAEDGVTLLNTRFCTLKEDAYRRDYTCNALYKNLHTGEVLDPTGRGLKDLKDHLLITPSEPGTIYRQDPVRMLRGIRFKHQKNFRLAPTCWQAILENASCMAVAAPKRVRDELNKMLKCRTFGEGISDLLQTGLLQYVMPGITEYLHDNTVRDNAEEGVTLWEHTRRALFVQGKEHTRTDNIYRLACLMMDIALIHGREAASKLLTEAGIGKEKTLSVLHVTELYNRFSRMFQNGKCIASPRTLPHFCNALAQNRDEFRRLVRALNAGLRPEVRLPWNVFYDENGALPDTSPTAHSYRRGRTLPTPPVSDNIEAATSRKHKRNIKRREQRKRAKSRRNDTAS